MLDDQTFHHDLMQLLVDRLDGLDGVGRLCTLFSELYSADIEANHATKTHRFRTNKIPDIPRPPFFGLRGHIQSFLLDIK